MARFISTTISTGQAVTADPMVIKCVTLTAGPSNDAVCNIYGAAAEEIRLAASKGTSQQYIIPGNIHYGAHLSAPVTLDLSGAGAFVRIDY